MGFIHSSRPQVGPSKFQKRHTIVVPSSQQNLLLSKEATSTIGSKKDAPGKSRPGSPAAKGAKSGLSSSLPRPSHFTRQPLPPKKKYSAMD